MDDQRDDKLEEEQPEAEPTTKRPRNFFQRNKVALVVCALVVALVGCMHAGIVPDPSDLGRDAGGFAGSGSYGGGGGSGGYGGGYGGYGGGYGGGSGYGGSYYYYYDDDDDDDDDDDYSYSYGGSSGSGGSSGYSGSAGYYYSDDGSSGFTIYDLVALVFILVILFSSEILGRIRNLVRVGGKRASVERYRRESRQPEGAARTPQSNLKSLSKLKERDPAFSAAEVEQEIANVYVKMQQAWTAGDFSPMRPYFDNALFSQFSNQLTTLRRKGHTNYVDNIAVLEVAARGWYESLGNEYLVLKVRTRITDYTLNRAGNLVSGHRDAESFMEYEYALSRTAGTQTKPQEKRLDAAECPNCGAPINIAQNARCEYCGSVIEAASFGWVISSIKGISQQVQK